MFGDVDATAITNGSFSSLETMEPIVSSNLSDDNVNLSYNNKEFQKEINERLTSDDSSTVPNVKSTSAATYIPNVPITTKLVVPEDAEWFLVGMEHLVTKEQLRSFQELYEAQNFTYINLPYQA